MSKKQKLYRWEVKAYTKHVYVVYIYMYANPTNGEDHELFIIKIWHSMYQIKTKIWVLFFWFLVVKAINFKELWME